MGTTGKGGGRMDGHVQVIQVYMLSRNYRRVVKNRLPLIHSGLAKAS